MFRVSFVRLLLVLCGLVFAVSLVVGSFDRVASAEPSQRPAGTKAPSLPMRDAKHGFPLVSLAESKTFDVRAVGNEASAIPVTGAAPLGMANGDLNADGALDLVVGYGGDGGGHLAIYQGNVDALSARTPEAFEAMKAGIFPDPFLPETRVTSLPISADFIGIGDLDRNGSPDIIAIQEGDDKAYVLFAGRRNAYRLTYVQLPGRATAALVGNIDPFDNAPDLAVAITSDVGASLLVYRGEHDAFGVEPMAYPLPAPASSLAIGQLDGHAPMDVLAAGNDRMTLIYGSYERSAGTGRDTTLVAAGVASVRIGNFIWDRENRLEIAVLSHDGTVRILEQTGLDKRPYTPSERRNLWFERREQALADEAARGLDGRAAPESTRTRQEWAEADVFYGATSSLSSTGMQAASAMSSARMTPLGVEDLLLVDPAAQNVSLLISDSSELDDSAGILAWSERRTRARVTVAGDASTVAMPMRLNVMNRPGIVFARQGGVGLSYSMAAPAATFTVTKTADTYDGACNADCSLREALQAANAASSADIVMVPAGTYTINTALGGPDADTTIDPAAQEAGDWDVFFDTTITGAGQATTILQAAAAQPGHDRVLDAIQTGVGIPDLSISGVTIRNGRCRVDNNRICVDGGGLRYAVDNLAVLTISDSTITNNRTEVNTASPANNGGGIFGGQSDFVYTNITVTNNIAAFVESGCIGATLCGGEGGGVFSGVRFTSNPTAVSFTNSTITGNTANAVNGLGGRGGAYAGSPDSVSITGGTFSGNTAFTDAGGLRLFTPTTISGATISNNSARQNGGGIWSDPLANDNTPQTNTFTNLTMRGNTADSDGVIGPNNVNRGDGGAIFHGRGTLHLNNPTIGGAGAGEGNTAFNGGGIARTYSQFQAAIFNASTLNINSGGSIVGNQAINNGGGIINDATKTAAAGNASVLNMTGATAITFTNNRAGNHGGGIAVITDAGSTTPAASASLNNMTLRSNQANSDSSGGGDGGAFYQGSVVAGGGTTFTGTLTIGGSGFANQAVNGGGLRNNAGTITFPSGISITHNTASGAGGGISNAGTLSALTNVTITNNTAAGNGGGVHNTGTLGIFSNPALNSNSGATGGGIFSSGGALTINGGTVSNNTASSGKGGGVEHSGTSASSITGASMLNNTGSGVHITGAGSMDVKTSTITGNSGDGITMIGTGLGSHFDSNIIHTNGELGIDLGDNAVTPNDPNDTDTGPNNLQNFPVINWVRRGDGIGNVTLNAPNGKYRIQYYKNAACDPSGHGEGEVLMGSQVVDILSGSTLTFATAALAFDAGVREQITATATHDANGNNNFDDDGSTSEFSACRQVNRLPTFGTAQVLSAQQGSPSANSLIATVSDLDQAANTLALSVNGGASATVNGVTVSNVAIGAGGNVTADVIASCSASNATFTLRVTDTPGEFNEQVLTVNVSANAQPTLGNYSNLTVNAGSSGTISAPDAPPADNGTIASLTASAPGFGGTFSGNTATGGVTINNAGPFGVYTVTVTATDNCGAQVTRTFTLTVNAVPTITPQAGVTRQQGSPGSASQIAAVSDADQAEETLVVTVNAGASATVNGVTLSNIAVSAAGVVTADVVASCSASNASFTVAVSDANGASNNTTVSVSVTPNAAPTVGAYPASTVPLSGGTTVTPASAPTDNGSVTTATAAAPGFGGTLSVDPATGVVTVGGATPAGTYTVTVTLTDNCGVPTTSQFALTVVSPSTVTKSFDPATIAVTDQSTITLVLGNTNSATALSGVTVTDAFPANLAVAAPLATTNTCSGMLQDAAGGTLAAGDVGFKLVNGTIAANSTCTITVKVSATTGGTYDNTTSGSASVEGGTGPVSNTAQLTVNLPTSAGVTLSGRVLTHDGRGLTNAKVILTDAAGVTRVVTTGRTGAFSFDSMEPGATYIISVSARRFTFTPQVVTLTDDLAGFELRPVSRP